MSIYLPWSRSSRSKDPEVVLPFWPLESYGGFSVESRPCNAGPFVGSGRMQYGGAPEASR